jgi:hypothetical protein
MSESNFIIQDGVLKRHTGMESIVTIPKGVTSIGKKVTYLV